MSEFPLFLGEDQRCSYQVALWQLTSILPSLYLTNGFLKESFGRIAFSTIFEFQYPIVFVSLNFEIASAMSIVSLASRSY